MEPVLDTLMHIDIHSEYFYEKMLNDKAITWEHNKQTYLGVIFLMNSCKNLFAIVGIYSIGVKMTLKLRFTPMETTTSTCTIIPNAWKNILQIVWKTILPKKFLLGLDKQQKLWTLPCTHVLTLWFRHSLNWRILLLLSSYFKKQKWLCLEVSPNQIVENETRIYVLCFGLQRKWEEQWLSKFVKDNNGMISPRCTCLI